MIDISCESEFCLTIETDIQSRWILVAPLILSSCLAFREEYDLEKISRIIDILNSGTVESKSSEVIPPDMGGSLGFISGYIYDFRFGNFSTMVLKGEDEIVTHEKTNQTENYNIALKLGLSELYTRINYNLTVPRLFSLSGQIHITIESNAFQMKGDINYNSNRSCSAVLHNLEVTELDGFKVQLRPNGVIAYGISWLLQFGLNQFSLRIVRSTNNLFQLYLKSDFFKFLFSSYVCKLMEKA